ncbi:MAG: DUF2917 domain-containing protein [Ramlibacter sp.]
MTSLLPAPFHAPFALLRASAARHGPAYRLHLETGVPQRAARRRLAELPEVLTLARGDVRAASLHALADLRITCMDGTAWLTREGDPRDYVLEPGDQQLVRRGDALVLLGMPSATVLVASSSSRDLP